jgi:hypothetical protein
MEICTRARPRGWSFYGDGAATQFMSGIAAPLLAGAAVAVTGVVVQQPESLLLPGLTMLLLVAAASMLVGAVQFGFLARRYLSRPSEVAEWWPSLSEQARAERVRADLADDAPLLALWSDFARWSYGLGVVLLWVGVGSAVLPDGEDEQAVLRWVAAGLAWVVAAAELGWLAASRRWPDLFTPRALARRRYGND